MKLVVISDTHGMHRRVDLPDGDVLIHCGDSTGRGTKEEFEDVCKWMSATATSAKGYHDRIIIPGNHDECIESGPVWAKQTALFNGVWLLNDDVITLCEGGRPIKFYGSPWTPLFYDWSFMLPRDKIAEKWAKIPEGTNVLITHGPPYGHGDLVPRGNRHVGCLELLKQIDTLSRKSLKLHLTGHIHEGYGVTRSDQMDVTFVNASICTGAYAPTNKPIVVEV